MMKIWSKIRSLHLDALKEVRHFVDSLQLAPSFALAGGAGEIKVPTIFHEGEVQDPPPAVPPTQATPAAPASGTPPPTSTPIVTMDYFVSEIEKARSQEKAKQMKDKGNLKTQVSGLEAQLTQKEQEFAELKRKAALPPDQRGAEEIALLTKKIDQMEQDRKASANRLSLDRTRDNLIAETQRMVDKGEAAPFLPELVVGNSPDELHEHLLLSQRRYKEIQRRTNHASTPTTISAGRNNP